MKTDLEDLRVMQTAERMADSIWAQVVKWDGFAKDTVGKQLARAVDSIGANIAEAFGRFHYGQKIEFLYYARGSLYETKYWVNRALQRNLISSEELHRCSKELGGLAIGLNVFVRKLKSQRQDKPTSRIVHEEIAEYIAEPNLEIPDGLFTDEELEWLQSLNPLNLATP